MTTLPQPQPSARHISDFDDRLEREILNALSERRKARERGDWVTRMGWDLVIDSLIRIQRGKQP